MTTVECTLYVFLKTMMTIFLVSLFNKSWKLCHAMVYDVSSPDSVIISHDGSGSRLYYKKLHKTIHYTTLHYTESLNFFLTNIEERNGKFRMISIDSVRVYHTFV